MTKGMNTIAQEWQETKARISQLATALTNNEHAGERLRADLDEARAHLASLRTDALANFDDLEAIAERRAQEAPVAAPESAPEITIEWVRPNGLSELPSF